MWSSLVLHLASICFGGIITVDPTQWTFSFSQSLSNVKTWTAPVTHRIRSTDTTAPTATGSALSMSCARQELESAQIVFAPTSVASVTISFPSAFTPALGQGSWLEVAVASMSPASTWGQGSYQVTDHTTPLTTGSSVTLSSTMPTVLWLTAFVANTTAGKQTYTLNLQIRAGGNSFTIPINLYVFDVVLDITPHVDTYFMSQPTFQGSSYNLDQLDALKTVYLQHRMSAADVAWPAGFSWDDSAHQLVDATSPPSTTACIWANGCDTLRYGMGKGGVWNGVTYPDWLGQGFSSFQAVTTDGSRPDPFGGFDCNTAGTSWNTADYGGWMCQASYEAEWGKYLKAIENWLTSEKVPTNAAKGFWYTLNEPQVWADYTKAAYLCSTSKSAAPNLKVMLSREAHPWIYNHPTLPCAYDIWMSHVNRFPTSRTWDRQASHGETSWIYFLDSDANCHAPGVCAPTLAPFVSAANGCNCYDAIATSDGVHYRAIFWSMFSQRVTGMGYYLDNIMWDVTSCCNAANNYAPPRPRISAALLREGLEDYEYLYIANCRTSPAVRTQTRVDATAASIGYTFSVYNSDPAMIAALRHELGLYLEGSRADMPTLVTPYMLPFADVHFDFRSDPGTNIPYTANGVQWTPVDIGNIFNLTKGFGFQSQYMGVPESSSSMILQCGDKVGDGLPASTVCYDDYNHPLEFWVSIHPGVYTVTIGIGWPSTSPRDSDIEYVEINNVVLRNFTCSSSPGTCVGVREYSADVTVYSHGSGGALIAVLGSPYKNEYTIFSYLNIVAKSSSPIVAGPTCSQEGGFTPPGPKLGAASGLRCSYLCCFVAFCLIIFLVSH